MRSLEELANNYINKLTDNFYQLSNYANDEIIIERAIIRAKHTLGSKPIAFSLDDLCLVRITSENNYPRNLKFFALDERNSYRLIENPFYAIIGYFKYDIDDLYKKIDIGIPHDKIEYNAYDLASPRYRDTKHFSINSLASNIYKFGGIKHEFDKEKAMIIIEPLKERITDSRLAILNPVDTFFDLHDDPMEISDSAIFMIQEDFFKELAEEFKEKLTSHQVFLYSTNPALAVDIVLSFLGLIPQRSFQQSELKSKYFFENDIEINDEEYIKSYKQYMEYLNQHILHTSYLQVPEEYAIVRQKYAPEYVGLPGVLHSETKYAKSEQERTIKRDIQTYREYITYMFKQTSIDLSFLEDYLALVEDDVRSIGNLPFKRTFSKSFDKYEPIIRDMLITLTYPKYCQLTQEFNNKTLSKIDINRQG